MTEISNCLTNVCQENQDTLVFHLFKLFKEHDLIHSLMSAQICYLTVCLILEGSLPTAEVVLWQKQIIAMFYLSP